MICFDCSTNIRRRNEAMRLVVTTVVGIVFGFFLGASFPTLPLTKARWLLNSLIISDMFSYDMYWITANEKLKLLIFFFVWILQMNLPSGLLPSFDIAYIEDKYSGLSTHALLNMWASLKNKGSSVHESNNFKVFLVHCICCAYRRLLIFYYCIHQYYVVYGRMIYIPTSLKYNIVFFILFQICGCIL